MLEGAVEISRQMPRGRRVLTTLGAGQIFGEGAFLLGTPRSADVTALAECHLLSYLYACVQSGVVVVAYRDEASGRMVEDGKGGGAFAEVMLRPHVTVADESMVDAATAAHAQANALCFIANSVNFPVRHEPTIEVAGAASS